MSQPDPAPRRYKKLCKSGRLIQFPRPEPRPKPSKAAKRHEPPQPFEITALRAKMNLSIAGFAKALNVNRVLISYWEGGHRPMSNAVIPSFREMQRLSDHLLQRRANPDWSL